MEKSTPFKAVALFSGGLDSTLAVIAIRRQGVDVTALTCTTPFDPTPGESSFPRGDFRDICQKWGFTLVTRHLQNEMLEIVKNPKHGYGKNMNPCVDCRILMLREAKRIMDETGAHFLVTGEVLGQRPMSQRKDMLYHIDKEAGVSDLVLRPLSARLLRETRAERVGMVRRELLYSFSGKSRKPQIALAREFGLDTYPTPAGGCLLTEPNYAFRLRDLLAHTPHPTVRDIDLLRVGRHFRHSPRCKIIVGRDRSENALIEMLAERSDYLLRVEGSGSPITLVVGDATHEALQVAAALCARYSDERSSRSVEVKATIGGRTATINSAAADDDTVRAMRIGRVTGRKSITV